MRERPGHGSSVSGLPVTLEFGAADRIRACDLADRVYGLEKGHIRYEGSSREFREDATIRQQYLAF